MSGLIDIWIIADLVSIYYVWEVWNVMRWGGVGMHSKKCSTSLRGITSVEYTVLHLESDVEKQWKLSVGIANSLKPNISRIKLRWLSPCVWPRVVEGGWTHVVNT
jgi:hypothetical protein